MEGVVFFMCICSCSGLNLAGCQASTKASLSLSSTAGQGRENMKGSWAEIKTERDHSPSTVMLKTDSASGYLLN